MRASRTGLPIDLAQHVEALHLPHARRLHESAAKTTRGDCAVYDLSGLRVDYLSAVDDAAFELCRAAAGPS